MSIYNSIFEHYRENKKNIENAKNVLLSQDYYILDLKDLPIKYKDYVKKQEQNNIKPLKFKRWDKKVKEALVTLEKYIAE
tara:strand:- start:106 stop:345 length:240 start_codon:yes stop_codon:yes gene_type:complete